MIVSDSESVPSNRTIRDQLIKVDIARSKQMASEYASLRFFSSVCQNGSWMAIWDAALEHGSKGNCYTQALLCALSQPVFGDRRCPLSNSIGCNCCIAENVTAMEHFCNCHSISADVDTIINAIIDKHHSLFTYGEQFFISSICNYLLSVQYKLVLFCFYYFYFTSMYMYCIYCFAGLYCTHSRKG